MVSRARYLSGFLMLATAACTSTSHAPLRAAGHDRVTAGCAHPQYVTKMVEGISPQTGEHGFVVQVMYAGHQRCTIRGYPTVAFLAGDGSRLPFHYRDNGGQYLTHRQPVDVSLRPGDSFFVAIAKYRCDISPMKSAKSVLIQFPGGGTPARITLHREGVASIDYCAEAPSQVVYLSPVVGVETDLFQ